MPDPKHLLARLYAAFSPHPTPAIRFVGWLAQRYGLHGAVRTVDVGTGPGLMLPFFAGMGWQVMALEPNPAFAAYAAEHSGLPVREGGFRDLAGDGATDLITALGSPLAYLLTPAERLQALRCCWMALRPGGVLLLEMWNLFRVLRYYEPPAPQTVNVEGHLVTQTRRHRFDDHAGTLTQTETYSLDDGSAHTLHHTIALITVPELTHMLGEAGFTGVETFNGYDARQPARVTTTRYLIAARRPTV